MNCRICVVFVVLMFVTVSGLSGQDWQNRDVLHLTAAVGKDYYLVAWPIGNFKSDSPRTTNLFFGVGRGDKSNWIEVMAQKQWNSKGGFWAFDARCRIQLTKRLSVYAEPAAFVTQPGFYHFVILEYRVWKKLSARAEEESAWRPAASPLPKQYNFGPGIGLGLGSKWGVDYGAAFTYRFSLTGPNEPRVYFSASKRFNLRRGRK